MASRAGGPHQCIEFFDREQVARRMKHCMAVRTHGSKITHRVQFVTLPNLGKWSKMMYMEVPVPAGSVHAAEVEPTGGHGTSCAKLRDTGCAGSAIPFICVNRNLSQGAFNERIAAVGGNFVGQWRLKKSRDYQVIFFESAHRTHASLRVRTLLNKPSQQFLNGSGNDFDVVTTSQTTNGRPRIRCCEISAVHSMDDGASVREAFVRIER